MTLFSRLKSLRVTPMWLFFPLFGFLGGLVGMEIQEGRLQAMAIERIAQDIHHHVELGESASIIFPLQGPYDARLGYTALPRFIYRLKAQGAQIVAQAQWSERLTDLVQRFSLFPVYDEKAVAGLTVLDRHGAPLYDVVASTRAYFEFGEIPPVVAKTLMFVENRELLDPDQRHRNPAVEWDRFMYAVGQKGIEMVKPGHKVPGASTLATQMEKYRHSKGGRTQGAVDKFRQMASGALRAYLHGPDTRHARQEVLRDYLNSVPLSAVNRHGAVHGYGDAMWAYFGSDFDTVNATLHGIDAMSADPADLGPTGEFYRQTVALMLSLRRPSRFLLTDHDTLEQMVDYHLQLMHAGNVIPAALRDAALDARLDFQDEAEIAPIPATDRKAADATRIATMESLGLDRLYTLDQLDLTVTSTFDGAVQQQVSAMLSALQTVEGATAAQLFGRSLLEKGNDPSNIEYSVSLYERVGDMNAIRVHTDTINGPFSLNDGMKLELGSTAKLRTLITWLEYTAELYDAERDNTATPPHVRDTLHRWVHAKMRRDPEIGLAELLERALDREFSASPAERFFTGGGIHVFHNFDDDDDTRVVTIREALRRSINLPCVRMMREIAHHITYREAGIDSLLRDMDNPKRREYLERFALFEGEVYLQRAIDRYRNMTADAALEALSMRGRDHLDALAIVFRAARPEADLAAMTAWLTRRLEEQPDADELERLYAKIAGFDLQDRGYVTRIHPLELWRVGRRRTHPGETDAQIIAAARAPTLEVYRWLIDSGSRRKQNTRLHIMIEQDAFDEIHARWKALGYPFDAFIPSYGTALGSAGDRPTALAKLMGVLSAGGVRYPVRAITRYHFAQFTPFETVISAPANDGLQVLKPEVAAAAL
ncbi:MAG: membrane peptidoglycan carboxypeptidase, partial [Bradymonadia bacterium]